MKNQKDATSVRHVNPVFSPSKLGDALAQVGGVAFTRAVGVFAGFALTLAVTNLTGLDEAGVFLFFYAILLGGVTLARAGLFEIVVRTVGYHDSPAAGLPVLIANASASSLVGLLLTVTGGITSFYSANPIAPLLLGFGWLVVPLSAISLLSGILQGARRPLVSAVFESCLVPGLTAVGFAGIAISGLAPRTATVVCLVLGTASVGVAVAGMLVVFSMSGEHRTRPGVSGVREILSEGLPLLAANVLGYLSRYAPLIALGIWSTPSETALFAVVNRVGMSFTILVQAVNGVMRPRFAKYLGVSNPRAVQDQLRLSIAVALCIASLPVASAMVFRRHILGFFGEEFIAGSTALLVVLAAQAINIFTASSGALLNMLGHERKFRNAALVAAAVCILASLFLVPSGKHLGAAFAAALALSSWGLSSFYYAVRVLRPEGPVEVPDRGGVRP